MPSYNSASALPQCQFLTGRQLFGAPLPIVIPGDDSQPLPSLTQAIDFSGFNTLSYFMSVTGISGGDNLEMTLVTFDPETGSGIPSAKGNLVLLTATADGDYAGTLYLPSYYDGLAGLILPFFQEIINLVHNGSGGGDVSVTALKFWLSNV